MLRHVLISFALCLGAAGASAGVWFEDRILEVDGLVRYFRFYVPEDIGPDQPVVMLLHGGDSGFHDVVSTGARALWPQVADEGKFILVLPNGFDASTGYGGTDSQYWNDCRSDASEGISPADDVAFIEALLDWLLTRPNLDIDPDRIYLSGLSVGGLMAYRLLAEMPERFAALGVGIANLPAQSSCPLPPAPISTILVAGDEDSHYMPWTGGCVSGRAGCEEGSVLSAEQTRDYFLGLNGIATPALTRMIFPDADPIDRSHVLRERYIDDDGRHELTFLRVLGGGHNLPTIANPVAPSALAALGLGHQSHDAETAREMWNFFKRQRLGGRAPQGIDPGVTRDLQVGREADGTLTLRWSVDCMDGSRYGVYRGDLSIGPASLRPEPGSCDLTATSTLLAEEVGVDEFFLIVPNDGVVEGSYGRHGGGADRDTSPWSCYAANAVAACAEVQ